MSTYQLPSLPYDYASLEPFIDESTMRVHHDKHHQTYTDKLNVALEKYPDLAGVDLVELIRAAETKLPTDIRLAVINNGGGYLNHSFFWTVLAKPIEKENKPVGVLAKAIDEQFGGFDQFKKKFTASALALFGSGWTWLLADPAGRLEIVNTPNQNLSPAGQTPLLVLDLWEHAYYLKYQNRRPEYVDAFWSVIDWPAAGVRYAKMA